MSSPYALKINSENTPLTSYQSSRYDQDVREAFRNRSGARSKQLHQQRRGSVAEEHKSGAAEYVRSIVFGGLDGIITTFATVTSVAGASLSAYVILILGIAHLFADGVSMGIGDALSSQAEIDLSKAEREREQWEMENDMEGEVAEMIELYVEKGVSPEDAETIIRTLAKYPPAFLDHMMAEELKILPNDTESSPAKSGAVTMLSFIVFGSVPLLPYLTSFLSPTPALVLSTDNRLYVSILCTLLTLFVLGVVKNRVAEAETGRSWFISGLLTTFYGGLAALVSFIIGYALKWMGVEDTG